MSTKYKFVDNRAVYFTTSTVVGWSDVFPSGASLQSKNSQTGLALADPPCYEKVITIVMLSFFSSTEFQQLRTYA